MRHLRRTAIIRSMVFAILLGSMLWPTSCAKKNEGIGVGTVYVTIFQPNSKLSFDKTTFEVQLVQGVVRRTNDPRFDTDKVPTPFPPAAGPLNSPDNAYIAASKVYFPRFFGYPYQVFFVQNLKTGEILFHARFREEEIKSIVWSPHSDRVAVLTSSQHYSLNPSFWFRAMSGHPKPLEKYRLEIVDIQTRSNQGIDLPYQSSAGFGEIRGWWQI